MSLSFEQQIQQWVSLDNQYKLYSDKMRELREKKHELTESILKNAEKNDLTTVKITDGKLKFTSTKVSQAITFKYLEKSLGEVIKNENQAKQIIDYLKRNRESKVVAEIKRFNDK